jgi:hypothetical protein
MARASSYTPEGYLPEHFTREPSKEALLRVYMDAVEYIEILEARVAELEGAHGNVHS